MSPAKLLERNLRPSRPGDEDEAGSIGEVSAESGSENEGELQSDDNSDEIASVAEEDGDEEGLDSEGGDDVQQQISNISFGALRQAQDAISRKRKRGSDSSSEHEDKLKTLRARLRQIKDEKSRDGVPSNARGNSAPARTSAAAPKARSSQTVEDEPESRSESDSDSAPSEEESQPKSRGSKHAPAAQSSRHQVTRKRTVVEVPKRLVRDPRFDAIQQRSAHTGDSSKAYDFLREYEKGEIDELKAAIKRSKDEDDKTVLKRKVVSMENRIKAKAAKEREQEVLRRHRREEKERVQQGKQPYFLKRKEVKERALVDKFKGMKAKEREKVMDRRRKKEGQKEKKRMPSARRMVGS